jgi:hypothetical protein
MTPDSSTPIAPPSPFIADHSAIARWRSGPGAKLAVMIPSEVAAISAPPRPWIPRATISTRLVGARPPSSDASEKMISAATNVRRWPYTSPTRPASINMPPNTIAYALTTQLRSAEEKFSPTWIDGSATLTIPRSRITMNCATQQTASRTALD